MLVINFDKQNIPPILLSFKLNWCGAGFLFEEVGEVRGIGKVQVVGNLFDRLVAVFYQPFGFYHQPSMNKFKSGVAGVIAA